MGGNRRVLGIVLGLAGIAACGGQTGEGDHGANHCADQPARLLGDADRSSLGFSAEEVLAAFGNEQRVSLARTDGAPADAVLALRARPGSVHFVPTRQLWEMVTPDPCRGRLEQAVEVDLTLRLPNGDRTFTAAGRLSADSLQRARLTATLSEPAFDALRTFDLADGERLARLELRATLTPAGSAGQLTANIEFLVRVGLQPEPKGDAPRVRDFTSERQAAVAHWPSPSSCAAGELPLAGDQPLFDLTADAVVQSFLQPRELRWDDGTTTTLSFEATSIGTTCLADLVPEWHWAIDWPPLVPEDPALFGTPLELSIRTEDGRLQTRASTMLQYRANKTGGLEHAWLALEQELAPGDAGGWNAEGLNHQSERTTILWMKRPGDPSGGAMLMLVGPPEPDPCSLTTKMCVGLPGVSPTLIGGTIE